MPKDGETNPAVALLCLGAFAYMLTMLAAVAWLDALDFDPCDSVFKHASVDCLENGMVGSLVGGGAIALGIAIIWGAMRNGRKVYGSWAHAALMVWIGTCFAVTGAAAVYIGQFHL